MWKFRISAYVLLAILSLAGCSSDKDDEAAAGNDTGSSPLPVVVAPDIEIITGEMPISNTLQNTAWKLSSIEREDGSMYSTQPELGYFLRPNTNNFRIQFWCVYRDGNYTILNDGVLTTTSLDVMQVFDCPPAPVVEPHDIENLLTDFFDGKTIMFVQTETALELRSLTNEVLIYSACESNCLNSF